MPKNRRSLRAAALILSSLAVAAGTGALAQEASNTVGPPALKDFQLPGRRTTPPAQPSTTTTTPPASTGTAPPAAGTAPAATPAPRRETPAATRPAPARAQPAPAAERPRAGAAQPPVAPPPAATQLPSTVAPPPQAAPAEAIPTPAVEPAAPAPAPAQQPSASNALPILLGGAAALLLGLLAFFYLRRRRQDEAPEPAEREDLGAGLFKDPAPAPAARATPAAPVQEPEPEPRAWLDLDIKPERAAATHAEAAVHYELFLRNVGDAPARNIRIDARLFNASEEGAMAAFFQGPMHDRSGSPHIAIAPGGTLKLTGQVTMPKAEMREIEVKGVRIFVPMVAINAAYDWGEDGSGRTSKSWLVGRETEQATAKMGAFRLDLGPRIYRSVGQREGRLVRV